MVAYTRSAQTVPDDTPGGSTVRQGVADQNNVAIDDLFVNLNSHSDNEDGRSHAELTALYDNVENIDASVASASESAITATEQAAIATEQADRAVPMLASSVLTNQSSLSVATVQTLGSATVLYTGNGTSQDVVTGIDSVDLNVALNGCGYWLDRTVNQMKNDAGTVVASGTASWGNSAKGLSKVHVKSRSLVASHIVTDGLRGVSNSIFPDLASNEGTYLTRVTAFNTTGFSIGTDSSLNTNLATYVVYQELFTHISWGTTNQDKFYCEAYNPITGKVMIYYIGSGAAGHKIPHSQGVALDYVDVKNLTTTATDWTSQVEANKYLVLNESSSESTNTNIITDFGVDSISLGVNSTVNELGSEHIVYGARKSEQWTIVKYNGTATSGNYVALGFKPSKVIIKATSDVSNWNMFDNQRVSFANYLLLNDGGVEGVLSSITVGDSGITFTGTNQNEYGVSYIIIAQADTNTDGGGSYYPRPTDGLLNVNGGYFNYSKGLDDKGYILSSRTVTKSIDLSTADDGFNWVAEKEDGSVFFSTTKPDYTGADTGISFKDGQWHLNNATFDPALSFIPLPVMVSGGNVQYLGDDEIPQSVMNSLSVGNLEITDATTMETLKVTDGFDLGQSWQDVLSSRAKNITFTNNTGKPIVASLSVSQVDSNKSYFIVDGINVAFEINVAGVASMLQIMAIVPNGSTYGITTLNNVFSWAELR